MGYVFGYIVLIIMVALGIPLFFLLVGFLDMLKMFFSF